MATLDETNVEKKFRGVSATQENIQSLSLWVLHHKANHEKIVDIWFKVLKKSKMPHRLTLFYLCNDIVQNCKRKHALCYKDQFKEVLKDATLLVRDNSIRPNVERLFTIWAERGVYSKEFSEELKSILNNTKVRATMSSKLLTDFKPNALVELIVKVKRYEDEVELRRRQLTNLRLDASSIEAIKQLKDRRHGEEFMSKFEDSCGKLSVFVGKMDQEIKDRISLIELLEQSELFYDAQHGEAKIVANAYKNFGSRVSNLRKRLEEHKKTLPDPSSPVPSPPHSTDVPSPADSPEPTGMDNIEMIDMEMSDEEADGTSTQKSVGSQQVVAKTNLTRSYLQPIASVTEITMKSNKSFLLDGKVASPAAQSPVKSQSPDDSPDTLDVGIPGLMKAASSSFLGSLMASQLDSTDSENSTPQLTWTPERNSRSQDSLFKISDEGPQVGEATPVMDEPPESDEEAGEDENQGDLSGGSKQNPMDFLTQLINQSNKSASQGGASASFFKNVKAMLSTAGSTGGKEAKVTDQEERGHEDSALIDKGKANSWRNWEAPRRQSPPPSKKEYRPEMQHNEPTPVLPPANSHDTTATAPSELMPPIPPPTAPQPPAGMDSLVLPRPLTPPLNSGPDPHTIPPFSVSLTSTSEPATVNLPPPGPPPQLPQLFPHPNFTPTQHPMQPGISLPELPSGGPQSGQAPPMGSPAPSWGNNSGFSKPPLSDAPGFNPLGPPPPPPPFPRMNSGLHPQSGGGAPSSPMLRPPPRPPHMDQFLQRMQPPPQLPQPMQSGQMPPPPNSSAFNAASSSSMNPPAGVASISVIGSGGNGPHPFMFPPPPQPPIHPADGRLNPQSLPVKPKHDALAEVQEEFIQQLKRKSAISSAASAPSAKRPASDTAVHSGDEDISGSDHLNKVDTSSSVTLHGPSEEKEGVGTDTITSGVTARDGEGGENDSRDTKRRGSSGEEYGAYGRGGGASRDWHEEGHKSHMSDSHSANHAGHRDGYMSERDRWAYEMAKQQYYKDMYGYGSHSKRPRPPPPPFSRGYHHKY